MGRRKESENKEQNEERKSLKIEERERERVKKNNTEINRKSVLEFHESIFVQKFSRVLSIKESMENFAVKKLGTEMECLRKFVKKFIDFVLFTVQAEVSYCGYHRKWTYLVSLERKSCEQSVCEV